MGYQDELRRNIQERQLKEYIEIGNVKLEEFKVGWDVKFEDFRVVRQGKLDILSQKYEDAFEKLN